MVVNAIVQLAPVTEATLDSRSLPHMSDTDVFVSDCEALNWVIQVLGFAGFIATACEQAHFTIVPRVHVLSSMKYFPPYVYSRYGNEAIYGHP